MREAIKGVFTAEKEAIKTLVHLHLASWWEQQAVFQDAEKHWKQLEDQQVAPCQMVRSLLAERQPSMCVGAGAPSHHPSSLQSQLPGGLEPFFSLPSLLRGCSEHATFPFPSLLRGSECPFSPLPSPLREDSELVFFPLPSLPPKTSPGPQASLMCRPQTPDRPLWESLPMGRLGSANSCSHSALESL
ncbi:hypothetical protein SRHO_G00001660 [Serrasalmus rhombeus]